MVLPNKATVGNWAGGVAAPSWVDGRDGVGVFCALERAAEIPGARRSGVVVAESVTDWTRDEVEALETLERLVSKAGVCLPFWR